MTLKEFYARKLENYNCSKVARESGVPLGAIRTVLYSQWNTSKENYEKLDRFFEKEIKKLGEDYES